jgi:hypothetical protein
MNRRVGIVSLAALGPLLLCGATGPTQCTGHIGPSTGEVVGATVGIAAAVVVGTVVLIEVNKSHHTIKGCVTSGPDGLEVHDEKNNRTYALTGVTANVKPGDIVKVSGSKQKNAKDNAGNQDFKVAKMSRDYGPCTAPATPAPAANTGAF